MLQTSLMIYDTSNGRNDNILDLKRFNGEMKYLEKGQLHKGQFVINC